MVFSPAGDSYENAVWHFQLTARISQLFLNRPAIVMLIASVILVYSMGFISSAECANKQGQPAHGILQDCSFDAGSVFMISSTTAYGELGWLLCTSSASNHSWLYRIPWIIELYPEKSHSAVSLTLTSKETPDGKYTLEGDITGNELNGSLVIENPSATSKSHTYALKGFRLNPPARKVTRFPAGRYSNSAYLEESGDPIGAELILFLTNGQSAGLIKFNESYWGEPSFVPLILSNILTISSQKLEFELRLGDEGIGKYSLTRQGGAVILNRVDVPTTKGSQFKLMKKSTLLPQDSFY